MAENGMSLDVAVALLMQRSDASDLRMDEKFEEVSRRLGELTEQVKKTNGRVSALELCYERVTNRIKALWHEIGFIKKKKEESGENRAIRAWHVWWTIATIVATASFMKFARLLQ